MASPRICSIEGCGKPHRARGYCYGHYERWRRHGDPLAGRGARAKNGEPQRYLHDVVLPYCGDDCLIWPFSLDRHGYGQVKLDGEVAMVHQFVCETVHGGRPSPRHESAHSCGNGNRGCVTPRHVHWATHAENMADMIIHGTRPRGERIGTAKLTSGEVLRIRKLVAATPLEQIAAMFGVHKDTVKAIISGRSWAWLT